MRKDPVITAVEITKRTDGGWDVWPYWADVDRPKVGGWEVSNRATALRLRAALEAGVVYDNPTVVKDNSGQTYVTAHSNVMARRMNADLRRLGF